MFIFSFYTLYGFIKHHFNTKRLNNGSWLTIIRKCNLKLVYTSVTLKVLSMMKNNLKFIKYLVKLWHIVHWSNEKNIKIDLNNTKPT